MCTPPQTASEKLKFFWKFPKSIISGKKLIRTEGIDGDLIAEVAKKTEGFSGREIFKLVVGWHDAAFSKQDPVLKPEIVHEILDKFLKQHEQKEKWTKKESRMLEKMIV